LATLSGGILRIDRSHLSSNTSRGLETDPSIQVLAGEIESADSLIE
jgi:folate-dependent tRNA-U54 methylase TrmFO/GidA